MPSPKAAMNAALAGDNAIKAIVGARVYPDQADDGAAYPHLIFQVVSDVRKKNLRGQVYSRQTRFQLTGYCERRLESEALETVLDALLDHAAGQPTIGGLTLKSSMVNEDEGAVDEDEVPFAGEGSGLRVVRLDVMWILGP